LILKEELERHQKEVAARKAKEAEIQKREARKEAEFLKK